MSSASPFVESWLVGPSNHKFYTRTYNAVATQKAVVVFLHGFIEHIARYDHIFPAYQARGITVFSFDQRGFGRTAEDKSERSKDASYGKTSTVDALRDVEWALGVATEKAGSAPVFLMGHSMGGALVLYYATQSPSYQHKPAGIIATSPLILQAVPAPRVQRWAGGKLSALAPNITISAPINADDLSHDETVGRKYIKDPLVKQHATLKCISDMLNRGEELLSSRYTNWPEDLPLLVVHGTEDRVTSHKASEQFTEKIGSKDKTVKPFTGGYHELHNEPDGVSEKLVDDCIAWIEAHLQAPVQNARL